MADAVRSGGGEIVQIEDAEALIWYHSPPALLVDALARAGPRLRWVSLPAAGIDRWAEVVTNRFTWTAAKGVYAEPVAEHALALSLAGLRRVGMYSRVRGWSRAAGTNLLRSKVVVIGGGGIASSLVQMLEPFDARVTVVRRRDIPLRTARIVCPSGIVEALETAQLVVVAAALTPETRGIIAARELAAMRSDAWLVNVGRGPLVVTDDLVGALRDESIGGAALDVTDPEPLPREHELWSFPNCIITPHVGNTPEMHRPLLMGYVEANVRRFAVGEPLAGVVDVASAY